MVVANLVLIIILLSITSPISLGMPSWKLIEVETSKENDENEKDAHDAITTTRDPDGFDYVTVNIFLVVENLQQNYIPRQPLANLSGRPSPFHLSPLSFLLENNYRLTGSSICMKYHSEKNKTKLIDQMKHYTYLILCYQMN